MGILGALSTSVSGLAAQSYALENISGNIANAATVGFKRVDTSFVDLIPDQPAKQELAGSVRANSELTNTLQGTLTTTNLNTNVAISGNGFFVVSQNNGTTQAPAFSTTNLYTRRGDFKQDSQGYLVNGSGYYMGGTTYDPTTGAAIGVSPSPIKISSAALAAQKTSAVNYSGNLPALPKTANYTETAGSELLPGNTNGTAGSAFTAPTSTKTVTFTVNGTSKTATLDTSDTVSTAIAKLNTAAGSTMFSEATSGGAGTGKIKLTTTAQTVKLPAASLTALGFSTAPAVTFPTSYAGGDSAAFVASSISGGQVTVYNEAGTAANLQLRWAKTASTTSGGTDTWQLFYQNDSSSSSSQAWSAVGDPLSFNSSGKTTTGAVSLAAVTIGGVSIGDVSLSLAGGLTQFGDATGAAAVSLGQDGYTSGTLSSMVVGTDGTITGSYSNGQAKKLGQISIAQFSASDAMKRENGGAYSATTESGTAVLGLGNATLTGGSVEASNTDISSEFSKMIVTQQAYSANTKVMSTAQQMLQDIINIIR